MLRASGVEVSGGFPADGGLQPALPDLVLTQLAGNIAQVALNSLSSDDVVDSFAALLDADLRGAYALILDLRRNRCGRGASANGWKVMACLMEQSFCTMRWLRLAGRGGEAVPAAAGVWSATMARPFAGPVALLLGRQTGPAGEDFAASFETAQRGPLLGESTGGDGLGVAPQQQVRPRISDLQAGRDVVLHAAWQALRPVQSATLHAARRA
jgi:C-terminal processing protease CtpA/Prc